MTLRRALALLALRFALAMRDESELHHALAVKGETRAARAQATSEHAALAVVDGARAHAPSGHSALAVVKDKAAAAEAYSGAAAASAEVSAGAANLPNVIGSDGLKSGRDSLTSGNEALASTVVGFAAKNDGACPSAEAAAELDLPGWDKKYLNGAGCALKVGLCKCKHLPFYSCATKSRLGGGQVTDGVTGDFVSKFGYCRVSTWVLAISCVVVVFLIWIGAYCVIVTLTAVVWRLCVVGVAIAIIVASSGLIVGAAG